MKDYFRILLGDSSPWIDGEDDEGVEEEPLGSEDDISDEDASDLFDTENVVVCQYDKITRARNKWKFHLKVKSNTNHSLPEGGL